MMKYLNIDATEFSYQRFPIGLAAPVMSESLYRELLSAYPDRDRFVYLETIGHKYTLSKQYSKSEYLSFIRNTPTWRDFHAWVKSQDFIEYVLEALAKHHIELGEFRVGRTLGTKFKALNRLLSGKRYRPTLTARFEFSMLPADGGYVVPHTDQPSKLVTLVVSMTPPGEWDPNVGGGTGVNRPKSPELAFNRVNKIAEFGDMEVLNSFVEVQPDTLKRVKRFFEGFEYEFEHRHFTQAGKKYLARGVPEAEIAHNVVYRKKSA